MAHVAFVGPARAASGTIHPQGRMYPQKKLRELEIIEPNLVSSPAVVLLQCKTAPQIFIDLEMTRFASR
jgi:hypothetical protein